MGKTITECASCGYPLAAEFEGQTLACPMCKTINEVITDVTIPTPLFVGTICFALGMFLGPALMATTSGGRDWLERQARSKVGK